jgi:hypothetical protein
MKNIEAWTQDGKIFLWRYLENTKNYPGWHLAFDIHGGTSLLQLLSIMKTTNDNCMRTITLSHPSAEVLRIPNNRHARVQSKPKLRLRWQPHDGNVWAIEESDTEISMVLGTRVSENVIHAIENPGKAFDETIAVDPLLWFWGSVEKRAANQAL